MSKANDVVTIALSQVGYCEKETNSNLDSATGNAGDGNYTKYAVELNNAGYYNGSKNGYAWCDVFVDWCFYKVFGKTEGQLLECQTGSLGAACPYSASYYKAQGRLVDKPKVGDQVFFQQGGSLVHTGIVVAVTDAQITTVEGNKGNKVSKCTYSRSSGYIGCYGRPKYTEEDTAATTGGTATTATATTTTGGKTVTVTLNQLQSGSTGNQVKAVQRMLYSLGLYKTYVNGTFDAATVTAVKAYQTKNGLESDGVVGAKTWASLLGT